MTEQSLDCSNSSGSEEDAEINEYEQQTQEDISSLESSEDTPENDDDDDEYQAAVRQWTHRVVLKLGLCPWAGTAQRLRRLSMVICQATCADKVVSCLLAQVKQLLALEEERWWTTLLICPHVEAWQQDFDAFECFVQNVTANINADYGSLSEDDMAVLAQCTLVAFHPHFVRWYSLPDSVHVGSTVQAHCRIGAGQKSQERFDATVLETQCPAFGRRKVKVQSPHLPRPQYIPIDWCATTADDTTTTAKARRPLCDNAMHRAPYPTIHILRNRPDLASLTLRDVSRVKRRNAQRMMALGWEGLSSLS